MTKNFLSFLALIITLSAVGQLSFENHYYVSDTLCPGLEEARMIRYPNRDIVFAGITRSDDDELVLIKYDKDENILWRRQFKTNTGTTAIGNFLEAKNGDYVVVGHTTATDGIGTGRHGNSGNSDGVVVRMNSVGDSLWSKVYGGSENDLLTCVLELDNGNFLLAGDVGSHDGDVSVNYDTILFYQRDIWFAEVDGSDGTIIREKVFGGTNEESITCLHQKQNGNYLIVGSSTSFDIDVQSGSQAPGNSMWVAEIDTAWNVVWEQVVKNMEALTNVDIDEEGNIMAVGYASTDNVSVNEYGGDDFYLAQINSSNGKVIWESAIGGRGTDIVYGVTSASDGYIITGSTTSLNEDVLGFSPTADPNVLGTLILTAKFDKNGKLAWYNDYGPLGIRYYHVGRNIEFDPSDKSLHLFNRRDQAHLGPTLDCIEYIRLDTCTAMANFVAKNVGGSTIKFTNTSLGNTVSHKWWFSDSTLSTFDNPVHEFPEGTSAFEVCLASTNKALCSDTVCMQFDMSAIGIDELNYEDYPKLVPSANEGVFNLTNLKSNNRFSIIVYTLNGKEVSAYEQVNLKRSIDLSHLSNGMYICRFVYPNSRLHHVQKVLR